MMVASATSAPPAKDVEWDAIDWRAVHDQVRQLQVSIAKAVGEKPVCGLIQKANRLPTTGSL
jgi:hypothetical protein